MDSKILPVPSLREAARQAIEALECFIEGAENPMETRDAVYALRAALAVPDAAPLPAVDAEKAFNAWNFSGSSEETDVFYRLNSAGKLERAFHDGLRAGEVAHNIKAAQ